MWEEAFCDEKKKKSLRNKINVSSQPKRNTHQRNLRESQNYRTQVVITKSQDKLGLQRILKQIAKCSLVVETEKRQVFLYEVAIRDSPAIAVKLN